MIDPPVGRVRCFAGYSGWGPLQLEGELATGLVVRRRRRADRPVDVTTGAALVRGAAAPARANRPVRALSARSGGELRRPAGNRPRRPVVEAASAKEDP